MYTTVQIKPEYRQQYLSAPAYPAAYYGYGDPAVTYSSSSTSGDGMLEKHPYIVGAIVVGVLGLIGFMVYTRFKVMQAVAEKQGVGGVLALEGGEAAIGILGHALGGDHRSNRRRRRYRRRK
jgi:hypothetical protein